MSKWQIVGYRATYMSSSDVPWTADIRCYESLDLDAPETGIIRFYPDGTPLPDDGWVNDQINGEPIVNYHLSQFKDVLALIQNEDYTLATTFFYTSGSDAVRGWGVSAGMEEAGEMEAETKPELDTARG